MLRLLFVSVIVFLLFIFLRQLKIYLARDNKAEELKETEVEGEILDMEKEIVQEKARQDRVSSEINSINTNQSTHHNKGKDHE